MKIIELNSDNIKLLQDFKDTEYPKVDKEHYGENLPNFETYEFTLTSKEDEKITGFIHIIVRLGIAYIDSLLVGEQFRKKGIGQKLVIEAETKAKFLGAHKIWLDTGLNWGAKEFYERLGYTIRTILPNDVAHQDCILMDKML